MTKTELEEKYEKLEEEYNELKEEYDELEEEYNELEDKYSIENLLHELRFNAELQENIQKELFKEYKEAFINMLRLYSVEDIPDEIYDMDRPKIKGLNDRIYRIIEQYVEENFRF